MSPLEIEGLQALGWKQPLADALGLIHDSDLVAARVIEEQKGAYRVATASADLPATLGGRLRHGAAGREDLPAVGDWVALKVATGLASIRHVLPRSSALVRRAAGSRTEAQIVAANVDVVLLVVAIDRPLNPASAERALALVWESGAAPVLVLNKADLSPDPEREAGTAAGVAPGVPVHLASAKDGAGLDTVAGHLGPGRTGAVVGPSGVGKSTLVNRLLDSEVQSTGDVREWDRRGRHTTTTRELVRLPAGGVLIDTPGMREMGLWDSAAGLDSAFADIEELATSCAFRDCAHATEPDCAVRGAVAGGSLDPRRLQSWVKLRRELAWQERRHDLQARLAEQRRWKRIARAHRRRDADRE